MTHLTFDAIKSVHTVAPPPSSQARLDELDVAAASHKVLVVAAAPSVRLQLGRLGCLRVTSAGTGQELPLRTESPRSTPLQIRLNPEQITALTALLSMLLNAGLPSTPPTSTLRVTVGHLGKQTRKAENPPQGSVPV